MARFVDSKRLVTQEPCSGIEPLVAERVEAIMPLEGITPGTRQCNDAQPDRWRVDFVYPDATPTRIALEVTGLWDGSYRAGARFADTVTERLSQLAERERLGAWLVAVRADEDLRALEREIVDVIRDAQPNRERMLAADDQIRPGSYTSSDLARLSSRAQERRFMDAHERLKAMGLIEVKPIKAGKEHVVAVLPTTGVRTVGAFDELLQKAVDENATKVGEPEDHEGHVAVYVSRFDLSTDPSLTAVPGFPSEVDVVWVVHRYWDASERRVWFARRGQSAWRVHVSEDPDG